MNEQFDNTTKYGYLISRICLKHTELYSEEDYNSIKLCENIDELLVKLMRNYKHITEETEHNKTEIRRKLFKSLIEEFNDFYDTKEELVKVILDYYLENHKIHNFFFLLQSKVNDPDLDKAFAKLEIGDFDELKTLKFCKDMYEVQRYCIENSFLKKYFYKVQWKSEIKDNDFIKNQALFLKYHIEDTYRKLENTNLFIKEILKIEGDRYILDITMNTMKSKDIIGQVRQDLYPNVHSFPTSKIKELANMELVEDLEESSYNEIVKKEITKYNESFSRFNDITCVYSYFKLKEQEIKNIMWILECIIQDRRQELENICVREPEIV